MMHTRRANIASFVGGKDDAGLTGISKDIFASYKSLHGVGWLTMADKTAEKRKTHLESVGMIIGAGVLVVALLVATALSM